jgi:hypothetical protein
VPDVATVFVPERRRFPRFAVRSCTARLQTPIDVEVIEISLTGGLIRCPCPLRVGDHAEIQTVLGQRPFVASIRVIRIANEHARGAMGTFGVKFVAASGESAAVLQSFLGEAG